MIEDENMQKVNRITVLRAKKEYQMIKQARQEQKQKAEQAKQQKVKEMIEKIEAENKANEDGKRPRQRQRRSVICITTGEVFNTIKDAVKKYKVHATNISQCCRGKVNHTGKLPDGTPLEWRYIDIK